MVHTYLICNKIKEEERFHYVESQLSVLKTQGRVPIDYSLNYYCYCWGSDITEDLRSKYCTSDECMMKHGRSAKTKPLTNGEISLFLNHINCLKHIRDTYEDGFFLILESDVLFLDNFSITALTEMTEDMTLIPDIDVLNIGTGIVNYLECRGYPKSQPVVVNGRSYYKENTNRCTEAIVWKYNAICKFLDYFEKDGVIDGPYDTKLEVSSQTGGCFNIYWPSKPYIMQGSTCPNIYSQLKFLQTSLQ